MRGVLVGCDVGGTFTDAVALDPVTGAQASAKAPTTVPDRSDGVAHAIALALERLGARPSDVALVLHGTTTATNALLEGRLARVGLVTNAGFEDVLEIGRQDRPSLYDLDVTRPPALVARDLRFGVRGRIDSRGKEIEPLDEAGVRGAGARLATLGVEALAVCMLHAHTNAVHEQAAARVLAEALPEVPIVTSSGVSPEFREVERFTTTVLNAGLLPLMAEYLARLEARLAELGIGAPIAVLDSAGALLSAQEASRLPVRTVLSGPAGGAAACVLAARELRCNALLGVDMGGTSTDVTLTLDGRPTTRWEASIGGYPLQVPCADIHTVGAGGGSIAWVDDAGGLRVGPQSAGASPGPAAYARGGRDATVTDANVVLGRIPANALLGGSVALDAKLADEAVARVASRLGSTVHEAAVGILKVASARALRGIRVLTARHAVDPASLTLLAFGGAGPQFGCEWADDLGIRRVVVPRGAGVTSAAGLLAAPPRIERSRTVLARPDAADHARLDAVYANLDERAARALGRPVARRERLASARYVGQGHELTVTLPDEGLAGLRRAFEAAHRAQFGYALDEPIEVVTLRSRVEAEAALRPTSAREPAIRGKLDARKGAIRGKLEGPPMVRAAFMRGAPVMLSADSVDGDALAPGSGFAGPAIVAAEDATTVVPPGWRARVDAHGRLVLDREVRP